MCCIRTGSKHRHTKNSISNTIRFVSSSASFPYILLLLFKRAKNIYIIYLHWNLSAVFRFVSVAEGTTLVYVRNPLSMQQLGSTGFFLFLIMRHKITRCQQRVLVSSSYCFIFTISILSTTDSSQKSQRYDDIKTHNTQPSVI